MKDDPASSVPMVEWSAVDVVDGIGPVLAYLRSSGRRIGLATSASISNETQIRAALARAGLDQYFSRIYCFKNTGLPKDADFYRHILLDLNIPASDALMVGDNYAKDVLAANHAGVFAVWFNPRSDQTSAGERHVTVHSMQDLHLFFESLDQS